MHTSAPYRGAVKPKGAEAATKTEQPGTSTKNRIQQWVTSRRSPPSSIFIPTQFGGSPVPANCGAGIAVRTLDPAGELSTCAAPYLPCAQHKGASNEWATKEKTFRYAGRRPIPGIADMWSWIPRLSSICPAPALRLLFDIARQYTGENNGQFGRVFQVPENTWVDVSREQQPRARRELEASRPDCRDTKGMRPNLATWYALTWIFIGLGARDGFAKSNQFPRGAYIRTTRSKNAPLHLPKV